MAFHFEPTSPIILRQHHPERFGEVFPTRKLRSQGAVARGLVQELALPPTLHCLVTVAGLLGKPGYVTSWLWWFSPSWPYLSIRHPVQGPCWSRRRGSWCQACGGVSWMPAQHWPKALGGQKGGDVVFKKVHECLCGLGEVCQV